MGITVKEAMCIGGLSQCRVVAGHQGLERVIDHVSIMEVPNVMEWLQGQALLLTSLYPIKDDQAALRNLVKQLNDKGSSALAIKSQRFFDSIPQSMINDANDLNFPIIEIGKNVSYLDIMKPVMYAIMDKSSTELDDYGDNLQWITELAMSGKGFEAIIQSVSKMLQNLITMESELTIIPSLLSSYRVEPLSSRQSSELRKSKRPIRMIRKLNGENTPCVICPLILNGIVNGYITCWETERECRKGDVDILERMIPLFALEFLKVKTKNEVDQQYRNEFLSDILLGNVSREEETIDKAKNYGWDLTNDRQVLVLDVDHFKKNIEDHNYNDVMIQEFKRNLMEKVKLIVQEYEKLAIVTMWSDQIVILHPVSFLKAGESLTEHVLVKATQLQKNMRLKIKNITFTIGIGRFYSGIKGIHLGFKDALQSIKIGKKVTGGNSIIHFDLLGVHRILGQFDNHSELESIYKETIGVLENHDEHHQTTNLTETLTQFFNNNCGLTETSEKMYIHVNTLKYRLQKIEQLTGYSLSDSEGRFFLQLGLKIKEIL